MEALKRPTVAAYGSWDSPVQLEMVGKESRFLRISDVRMDQDPSSPCPNVFYTIIKASAGGQYVVVARPLNKGVSKEPVVEWTPEGFSARTRVHEYGGAAFFVHQGTLYFSNMLDQQLYKQTAPTSPPERLTKSQDHFFADGFFSTTLAAIYIVREDHTQVKSGARKEAENTVVRIDPLTGGETVVVCGADFYSSPRVSSDGKHLLWVEWNHPNMPWDNTRLMVASLDPATGLLATGSSPVVYMGEAVAGKAVSTVTPFWTKDNKHIVYMGDQSGYWNLYVSSGPSHHVNLSGNVTTDLASPPWVFGMNSFYYSQSRDTALVCIPHQGLRAHSNITTAPDSTVINTLASGYNKHFHPLLTPDGSMYCSSYSTTKPEVFSAVTDAGLILPMEHLEGPLATIDPTYWSSPRHIQFPVDLNSGENAYGWFYQPHNPHFVAPEGTRPPLLVRVHGGPTSSARSNLSLAYQFWTTRGFAILDVNHRGSSGYGRKFRDSLQGNWGIYDVADTCAGVQYLVQDNLVDSDKICIDGGSAGGYTTLACIAFRNLFKAAASFYGVADLELLTQDTHKFESRYLDGLVGPLPDSKEVYHARSALRNATRISCPCAFFQGDEDKIVLPNQSELMFQSIKQKNIPCSLTVYKGEQHGFRKSENIIHSLHAEYYFFSRIFGFKPSLSGQPIKIDNLDA